jgi:LPXTG-motif cell wall-anchored protein
MRKTLTLTYAVLPLAVAAGAIVGLAGPASAVTPTCRTATTTLTDRADSGLHGDWAKDALVRTVKICEAAPSAPAVAATDVDAATRRATYTATVVDTGTFTTVAGKSPVAGTTLPAGVVGKLTGGYTGTFKAVPAFKNYKATFDGKTYSGTAPSTTGDWVKALWGGEDYTQLTSLVAWKWTYWTCSADLAKATETFTNAEAGNSGDITGKTCPSPSPSASAPVVVVPSASAPAGGTAGGLPVTGTNVGLIAGGGIVLLAAGAGLVLAGRKRRTTTT